MRSPFWIDFQLLNILCAYREAELIRETNWNDKILIFRLQGSVYLRLIVI